MLGKIVKSLVMSIICIGLAACGGNDDPVVKAVSDAGADIEIEDFHVNRSEIDPGQTVAIDWEAVGAMVFDVRLFLSKDREISSDDEMIVREECGIEANDHCSTGEDVEFYCRYRSDNSFDCFEDGDSLQRNDLTEYFDELPQDIYLILEVCSDGECDWRSSALTFY